MTIDDAARRLGVSRRTVYYRMQKDGLRCIVVNGSRRILLASLEQMPTRRSVTRTKVAIP